LGKQSQIIKLDATDSTNLFLKGLLMTSPMEDYTTVVAKNQLKGRGQMGTSWQSEGGKNLTFSVLKNFSALRVQQQFVLNIGVSMALCDVLRTLGLPNVTIKWPNDIMSGSLKICGILIENILHGAQVTHAVIGIGLNVNQTDFGELTKATSIKLETGQSQILEELLDKTLERLQFHLDSIEQKTVAQLLPAYEKLLFRKDKPSTFTDSNGERFMGFIRNVSDSGKLVIELEDQIFRSFDLKEVTLLY
jgi:BirA family biotin operon repressor/biotin-[acetyl-CoA-carboxylase] ligase